MSSTVNGHGAEPQQKRTKTNTTTNLCLQTYPKKEHKLIEAEVPKPGPNEALLQLTHVGICGSDVHFYKEGGIGGFFTASGEATILGHEGAAIVLELGGSVAKDFAIAVGDRVAIEPQIPCMNESCSQCRGGTYNRCPSIRFCGLPPTPGLLQKYICHPVTWLHRLPPHIPNEIGALIEPLSVGLHAVRLADVTPGARVLITGAGPIGLFAALCARAAGAGIICMTDLSQEALAFASTTLPFDIRVLRTPSTGDPKDVAELVVAVFGRDGEGPGVVIECSGSPAATLTAVYALKQGGTLALVGIGPELTLVPIPIIMSREIVLKGVNKYRDTWPTALQMMAEGVLDATVVRNIVQRRLSLTKATEGFETQAIGKTMIVIDG